MTNRQILISHCALLALVGMPGMGRADTVLDWNAIMQSTVSSQPPFPQARLAAITQLAVFEAVNAITRNYKPYLGTITAPPYASVDAAAATAAHDVLKNYFPAGATTLDAALASPSTAWKSLSRLTSVASMASVVAAIQRSFSSSGSPRRC